MESILTYWENLFRPHHPDMSEDWHGFYYWCFVLSRGFYVVEASLKLRCSGE